jgi:hypothetical protein
VKYFNFYETETVDVLQSPAYRARLDSPTEWTKKVVKEFRDTSRTCLRRQGERRARNGRVRRDDPASRSR